MATVARICDVHECDKPARALGLCPMHYYRQRTHGTTDAPPREAAKPKCPSCGSTRRRNNSGRYYCTPCSSRRATEWERANADRVKANKAAWRDANREHYRTQKLATYYRNRERVLQQQREMRDADPEAARARNRDHYRRNTDLYHARVLRRGAVKRGAVCRHGTGCVGAADLRLIRDGECRYCGAPAEHADHFMPLAKGGLHCVENLVPACARCNLSKGARTPDEWIEYLRKRGAA